MSACCRRVITADLDGIVETSLDGIVGNSSTASSRTRVKP